MTSLSTRTLYVKRQTNSCYSFLSFLDNMERKRAFSFLVLIIFLSQCVGRFSPYTIKDYTLLSQSYYKMFTVDWLQCVAACSQDPLCSAYDYRHEKPSGSGLCQLYECGLDRCLVRERNSMVFSHGHLFQQIKPNENLPKCKKDECASNPCVNNGTCTGLAKGSICSCLLGYTGKHCENDIDECSSHPCLNQGICSNHIGGFSCDCVTGYNGTTCEININDCADAPCQNGGTCIDKINGFSCDCKNGYSGKKCEEKHEGTCISNPCASGGTCHTEGGLFWCVCPYNYVGYICESAKVE